MSTSELDLMSALSGILGFLVWLKYVSGINFRIDNEPFKMTMQGFTKKIVDMMKPESLFSSQGGPIILSQHVFSCVSSMWLGTGVPWVMCKEDDAPDPVEHGNEELCKLEWLNSRHCIVQK
ncbi:hypothetical protein ZIOFF_009931 [Zingiber officinale]|uniref:beta-galactosidase n=1 Tax=Zingiber officinale TaxID=94328 RepID=A0A8J5HUQ4_ZINOF|nr:hypothetical protein ZIOFF_009931 [Zingiber officinale]